MRGSCARVPFCEHLQEKDLELVFMLGGVSKHIVVTFHGAQDSVAEVPGLMVTT